MNVHDSKAEIGNMNFTQTVKSSSHWTQMMIKSNRMDKWTWTTYGSYKQDKKN
jgi:hypothetical protein